MAKCSKCEVDFEGQAVFCPECGAPVQGAQYVQLEINDNHFYMEGRAGVLDFRLTNSSGQLLKTVVLAVRSGHIKPAEERLQLLPGEWCRRNIEIQPTIA
ncbi:MAG TPA: hypothetical protein VM223_20405, partial [Planctomycetota bacterium]|nr:hypothetical protein [Planctomycetota bacterium]